MVGGYVCRRPADEEVCTCGHGCHRHAEPGERTGEDFGMIGCEDCTCIAYEFSHWSPESQARRALEAFAYRRGSLSDAWYARLWRWLTRDDGVRHYGALQPPEPRPRA